MFYATTQLQVTLYLMNLYKDQANDNQLDKCSAKNAIATQQQQLQLNNNVMR